MKRFKSRENVLLTPHLGSATRETRTAMADLAVRNVLAVVNGEAAVDAGRLTSAAPMSGAPVAVVMRRLAKAIDGLDEPAVEKIAKEQQESAFQVLIATMLSAQTRDAVTAAASARLFRAARTPRTHGAAAGAAHPGPDLSGQLLPQQGRARARGLPADRDRFAGRVPSTMEELLTLPGVGRKTANLVLILAHGSRENICVDTHVHRIANRLGWVRTRTPEETEQALYEATQPPVVAADQSLPGHVGAERLPAGVSSVSAVRARGHLSQARSHQGREAGQSVVRDVGGWRC